ncbi:helix-turn-helix domain-containing protein [Paracoccus litorisediminis]|uniref:helix-turn-helix domain-containing protein n=1 Tax=Paracoccus litorisediminis TaxID=2006130 RepID=UPI00372FEE5E
MTPEAIGNLLRIERMRQGLTQADLAERSGLGKRRIEAVENGLADNVGIGRLVKLLGALGLELRIHEAALRGQG